MATDDEARDEQFSSFVAESSPALMRFAFLTAGNHDDAQELVQHALVKVYSSWDKIRDKEALEAYTKRIITRERVTLWRRWRQREDPRASRDGWAEGTVRQPDVETQQVLWERLRSLGARQRVAVVLRYYEDLSEAEIAEAMGCSVGTVKSQLSRALVKLRSSIGDLDGLGGSHE